jgi:hypothetical protein
VAKNEDAVGEEDLVPLGEAVAVGVRLEVLVIQRGLASGNLDMLAPLANSLRRLTLEGCPRVFGELTSAPVIGAPLGPLSPRTIRFCSVIKSSLLSQLHSGDLGSLVGLVNLQKLALALGDCDEASEITGEEYLRTLRLGPCLRACFRDCSVNTSDFFTTPLRRSRLARGLGEPPVPRSHGLLGNHR